MQHKNCCQFSLRSIIYNSAASCRELNPYVDLQHIFIYLCEMFRLYESLKVCIDIEHDQKSKVIVRNIFFRKICTKKVTGQKHYKRWKILNFQTSMKTFSIMYPLPANIKTFR